VQQPKIQVISVFKMNDGVFNSERIGAKGQSLTKVAYESQSIGVRQELTDKAGGALSLHKTCDLLQ
jgi:rhamnose utilization protein RhaD (predicted bifunctional aldolase and dehydrogenase)